MHIALATCSSLPDWEVDDQHLKNAFERRGVSFTCPSWDDAQFDWGSVDACLIRTTWDYMERREEFLAWTRRVETSTPLFHNAQIVQWNTHKAYLRELEEKGLPIAPTEWLDAGTSVDLGALLHARGWNQAFVKPAIGATARETLRFRVDQDGLTQAQAHVNRLLACEDILIQPYLSRVETEGETSVIFIDGEVTHAVRKIPVPGDYRVQDDFGAQDEPTKLCAEDLSLAGRVVAAVERDLLYARVDFLRDDAGALVVSELELVEPLLFFRHGPHAADRLVDALCARL